MARSIQGMAPQRRVRLAKILNELPDLRADLGIGNRILDRIQDLPESLSYVWQYIRVRTLPVTIVMVAGHFREEQTCRAQPRKHENDHAAEQICIAPKASFCPIRVKVTVEQFGWSVRRV